MTEEQLRSRIRFLETLLADLLWDNRHILVGGEVQMAALSRQLYGASEPQPESASVRSSENLNAAPAR